MNNPLIETSPLKHNAVPFDKIKPEHFVPAMDEAIAQGRKIIAEVKKKPAGFTNTLMGLEDALERVDFISGIYGSLLGAHGIPELQALMPVIGPKRAEFGNDVWLDVDLFNKIKEVFENREKLNLSNEQKFYVEKVYRDFAKSGVSLPADKKLRLREIDQRLSQIVPEFRQNVSNAQNQFQLWIDDTNKVPGLSQALLEAAKAEATAKGKPEQWLFTLAMPSYFPFMKFCANRELREEMHMAYNSRAFNDKFDNQKIIMEELNLVKEKANILGFQTYAHLALSDRMAETPERVNEFLHKILHAALPVAKKEVQEVADLAKQMDSISTLMPWDFAYYSEKLKEQKYAFDEDSLRPYFKLENVIQGVFEHAKRLYDLVFIENKEYPVYHPEVQVFEVHKNSPKGEFIGLFYADFFPRETKNGGAWMTAYLEQGTYRGKVLRPHVGNVCNFTKPTKNEPSLLTMDEVYTLFHEFGHALHGLLSKCEVRSLSGTNVYQDFVELPSQIMENWLQEEEALALFARHYQTGEALPKNLLEKIKKADLFQTAYATVRQLNFAILDMRWFTVDPKTVPSVPEFELEATRETSLFPKVDGTNISTGFSHIFGGGYASGYYSYKWAEALDADAFELFQEKGIFNKDVAKKFEEFILSRGGSDHPMRLYEQFRGRQPDPNALLRRSGLVGTHA